MADKNFNIIRTEENGVEFFTVVESGESGLSQSGIARIAGVSQQAISKLIKALVAAIPKQPDEGTSKHLTLTTKSIPKRLQRFINKDFILVSNASSKHRKGRNATIYTAEFCFAVIKHYALEGSEIAETVLDSIGEIGLTSYIQGKTKWLPYQ